MSVTCVQAGSHIHSMSLLFTLTAKTHILMLLTAGKISILFIFSAKIPEIGFKCGNYTWKFPNTRYKQTKSTRNRSILMAYRLNFDLNKSRQKIHHSLKEHHKISNIQSFVLRTGNWQPQRVAYWAVNFPRAMQIDWKTANFARLY
jgi:hypothetical protein